MKRKILAFLLVLAACSVTESTNVKTSGIWTHYVIENGNGTIRAYAVLRVGGGTGTILDLSGGEHVKVNGVRLVEWVEPVTNYHWSSAVVPADPNNEYDFNFVRTDEEVHTILHLPEFPEILEPVSTDEVCFGAPLHVMWDNVQAESRIWVSVYGDCIETRDEGPWPDQGEVTLENLLPKEGVVDGCAIMVRVLRTIDGAPNPAFQGGWIEQKAFATTSVAFSPCPELK